MYIIQKYINVIMCSLRVNFAQRTLQFQFRENKWKISVFENWLIFVGGQKSTPGSIFYGDVHLPDRSGRVFHHKRIQSPVSRHSVLVTAPLRLLIHPVLLSGCRLVITKSTFFLSFSFNMFTPDI